MKYIEQGRKIDYYGNLYKETVGLRIRTIKINILLDIKISTEVVYYVAANFSTSCPFIQNSKLEPSEFMKFHISLISRKKK